MKLTTAQLAVLAFALGITAAPAAEDSTALVARNNPVPRALFDIINNQKSHDRDDDSTVASPTAAASYTSSKTSSAASSSKTSSSDDDGDSAASIAATSPKSSTTTAAAATKTKSNSKSTAVASSIAAAITTSSSSSGSSGSGSAVSSGLPASSGTSALSAVQTIAAGESFDGGMIMYDRGVDCTGQTEGGDSDAVFQIEEGGTLSNVIIGPNQIEGVHCQGACTLKNVWWSAVCEDAFSIKNQGAGDTTYIIGGGAFGAEDKVVQHNGAGTVSISGFTVDTFGKLYRSCGNCDTMYERHVIMDSIYASDGSEIAGINYNYGDTATLTNIVAASVDDICVEYTGTDDNDEEPTEYASGADGTYCIYDASDITTS